MVKTKSPIELVKYLPGKNCNACELDSCFGFALSLMERTVTLDACTQLTESGRKALVKILAPPMNEVTFGVGERAVKIGGEEVMYRHEFSFFGKTALAIDVSDTMAEDALVKRAKEISDLKVTRYEKELRPSAIAVRSASGDKAKFAKAVAKVAETSSLPIILCSFDPAVLEAGLEAVKDKKPLLYAATKENWAEVLRVAKKYPVAVAIHSPGDLNTLGAVAKTFVENGVKDLVLDPGTFALPGAMAHTISNIIALRRACIENGVKDVSYPAMAVPAVIHAYMKSPIEAAYSEVSMASLLITRGVGLLILHSAYPWSLLPLLYLRDGVFAHGRSATETAVKAGIFEFNNPDENSPLLITTNFVLTYSLVSAELEKSKEPSYLLALDTKGLSADTAVGSGDFSADTILDALKEYGVEDRIKHRVLVVPRVASDIAEEIQEAMPGWKIIVGPKESTEIPPFLASEYKKILAEYRGHGN